MLRVVVVVVADTYSPLLGLVEERTEKSASVARMLYSLFTGCGESSIRRIRIISYAEC